jgi:hypothetical protein
MTSSAQTCVKWGVKVMVVVGAATKNVVNYLSKGNGGGCKTSCSKFQTDPGRLLLTSSHGQKSHA